MKVHLWAQFCGNRFFDLVNSLLLKTFLPLNLIENGHNTVHKSLIINDFNSLKRKKTLRILFILSLAICISAYLFLKFWWLLAYDYADMKYNAKIVDSAKTQPENFLKVWDKLYPASRNQGMNAQLWSDLTRELSTAPYRNCHCDEIGYTAWTNYKVHFKINAMKLVGRYRQFGYGLQYFTTPQKCFDFWLNNDIIWDGHYLRDMNELSTMYFKKIVDSLNEAEIIQLIAYRKLGSSRSRDSALFTEMVNHLTIKMNEN